MCSERLHCHCLLPLPHMSQMSLRGRCETCTPETHGTQVLSRLCSADLCVIKPAYKYILHDYSKRMSHSRCIIVPVHTNSGGRISYSYGAETYSTGPSASQPASNKATPNGLLCTQHTHQFQYLHILSHFSKLWSLQAMYSHAGRGISFGYLASSLLGIARHSNSSSHCQSNNGSKKLQAYAMTKVCQLQSCHVWLLHAPKAVEFAYHFAFFVTIIIFAK